MKKKVIALLLAVVMASGSIGSVSALAAETTAEEAVAVEEEIVEEATEISEETDAVEMPVTTAEGAVAVEEDTSQEAEEVPEGTEEAVTDEIEEDASAGEAAVEIEAEPEQDSASVVEDSNPDTAEEAEITDDIEEPEAADFANTSAEIAGADEPAIATEVEVTDAEGKEAALADGAVVDYGVCGENATWMLMGSDNDLTLTISGSGDMNDFQSSTMPWYDYKSSIKSIVINEGINSIGMSAFSGCDQLITVSLPSSLINISAYAFYYCEGLAEIIIPASVTSIGDNAFDSCKGLTKVSGMTGVTKIGKAAFSGCSLVGKAPLNEGLQEIGDFAFSGNSISEITIPSSVIEIGAGAFARLDITSVSIPYGIKEIKHMTFSGCKSLANVDIPDSVTKIDYQAFYGCESMDHINIPRSVNEISGDNVFGHCISLKNIYVSEDNNIYSDHNGVLFNKDKTKLILYPAGKGGQYSVQDGVTTIGEYAFYGVDNISTIILPSTVTNIERYAFSGSSISKIDLPNSLNVIAEWAFEECTSITEITIPESVTEWGQNSFEHCEGLKKVTISKGINVIPSFTFNWCKALEEVIIPDSVTEIRGSAFQLCSSLRNISIPDTVETLGGNTFTSSGLESIVLPNSLKEISVGTFDNCENLSYIELPDGLTKIWGECFLNCTRLTSVKIPASVNCINNLAFSGCTQLQTVYFEGNAPEFSKYIYANGYAEVLQHFKGDNLTAYYPADNTTWTEDKLQDYGGTITWIEKAPVRQYTVSYDANGGTGTPSAQIKYENISLALSEIKPTKRYTISYNSCGGSVSPASKSINCTFNNWNTAKNGSGTSYASGGNYSANANVTLYAQWTNPNAGDLATPTRNGYVFSGWYTASSGGNQVTDSTTITGNVTIYAHWKDPYNLGDETYSFENYVDRDAYGHCFGMSITSAGYENSLLNIGKIGGNASTPLYSFNDTPIVREPICYYQARQGHCRDGATVAGGTHYLSGIYDIDSDWQEVINYVKNHKYDNTGLLQIGIRKENAGGHAINFLRYENVNGQDRIYAYDNNFPTMETYFYQDSYGRVLQAPVATFSGTIDCIALRDVRVYFSIVGGFDSTRVLYMAKDAASVQGFSYSYMETDVPSSEEYVMYEIPADQDRVTIIPNRDNADFIYMDTEFSFGEITDNTRGELRFSSLDEQSGGLDASFIVYEESETAVFPTVTLSKRTFAYNGQVQKPSVTVKAGNTVLTESQDYIVEYPSGMVDIGPYKVKVTLIGNYSGTLYDTFEIVKAEQPIVASNLSLTYLNTGTINVSGNKGKLSYKSSNTAVATVDSTGKVTAKGAGTAKITITADATSSYNAATQTITVTVAKAGQSLTAKVGASSIAVGKSTTVSTTGAKGAVTYSSSNAAVATVDSKTGKVTAKKVGTVTITAQSAATANYNAASKAVTIKVVPAATASLSAANLSTGIKLKWKKVAGANGYIIYRNGTKIKTITNGTTVTFSDTKANTNGKKYTYKVVAKGATGTSTLSRSRIMYRVARTAVSSLASRTAGKMAVKWKKNAVGTGYQIQYSLKKNFKNAKSVWITKNKTTSKTIAKLKKGKKYNVRIRTYKKVGKVKYYSGWSKIKAVTIKK